MQRDQDPYLRQRYGIAEPTRFKRWVGPALVFAVIGGGWLLWSANHYSRPEIRSSLISFTAIDSSHMQLRYSVQFRSNKAHLCQLIARDIDANTVGEITDHFQPNTATATRIVIIPTRIAAVNAAITRCAIE